MPEQVHRPSHYQLVSGAECMDFISRLPFSLGSAVKYLWRYDKKGCPINNLQKALTCLRRYEADTIESFTNGCYRTSLAPTFQASISPDDGMSAVQVDLIYEMLDLWQLDDGSSLSVIGDVCVRLEDFILAVAAEQEEAADVCTD